MAAQLAFRFLSSATNAVSSASSTPSPPAASTSKVQQQPKRVSEVLPGVICKLCGTSVPMDQLAEHNCEKSRPPMPSLSSIPPVSRKTSSKAGPPSAGSAPVRRTSDPRKRRSPSPKQSVPALPLATLPTTARPPPRPSFDAGRSHPSVDERLGSKPHPEPSIPRNLPPHARSPPPEQRIGQNSLNRGPSPQPPPAQAQAFRGPPPGPGPLQQQRIPPPNGPPPQRAPSPNPPPQQIPPPNADGPFNRAPSPNIQQIPQLPSQLPPQGPPHPHNHPAPHHANTQPLPPQRIMSPGFDQQSKRSNTETPYFVDKRANNGQPPSGPHPPVPPPNGRPDPGREATDVLSTFGMPIPDTKVGGEAGMAGVGRRGFAAVAQAALIVQRSGMTPSPGSFGPNRSPSPGFGFGGIPRTMSPGSMQPYGPGGPGPQRMGSPGYGNGPMLPPGRVGSPNYPPMGLGGPPGQFLGPDPRLAGDGRSPPLRSPSPGIGPNGLGGMPPRTRSPNPSPNGRPSLDQSAGPRDPSGAPLMTRSPSPLNSETAEPLEFKKDEDERSPVDAVRDGKKPAIEPLSTRPPVNRQNTDVSAYTDDASPLSALDAMRRSPEPMTPEDKMSFPSPDDDGKTSRSRLSDASSSYTTTSLGPTRQAVNNVRNLFRKASQASSGSSESPTSPVGIRLPFLEKLMASKRSGSTSSNGSRSGSVTSPTTVISLGKSTSLKSPGRIDASKKLSRQKSLPTVQERRESTGSASDTELAYANFDVPPRVPPLPSKIPNSAPLALRRRTSRGTINSSSTTKGENSIPFPSPPAKDERRSGGRAGSTETVTSSESSSSAVSVPGANATKPIIGVKIVAPGDGGPAVEPTVAARGDLLGGDRQPDMLESPTSSPSPTSTSFSADSSGKKRRKPRQCRKCLKLIYDGKWVRVDVGTPNAGVMCVDDWKDSYLPKCRRCMLPIEGAVISASDGQITGKFHRECFTCVKCSKPFPDKSFYVFDGMPHCNLHYHEANGSLCGSCNQPIEGPCALAEDGRRFHPEHFLCDWEGGPGQQPNRRAKCSNRLEDYWEVGTKRYCSERHAMWAQEAVFQVERFTRDSGALHTSTSSKATKRRTLFVEQVVDKMAL